MISFNVNKTISLAAAILISLFATAVVAQDRASDRMIGSDNARVPSSPAASTFAVLATTPDVASDGLQFRIAYDPEKVRVSSTSDCLIGLPENLTSSLASCKDIQKLGFVQVAIVDFSGQQAIPPGLELGFVEFESIGGKASDSAAGASYWIEDVHVSGASKKAARESYTVPLGRIDY